jgi:hypothetical protein
MKKVIKGDAIEYVLGLPDKSNAILLHCVNAQGVFNAGIAKQIRARIPSAYEAYMQSGFKLGTVSYSKCQIVANMCAQEFYGRDGKRYVDYDMLFKCLINVKLLPSKSRYIIPYKMCCGLAGGNWEEVKDTCNGVLGSEFITYVGYVEEG